jgi:acyl-CoA thioester hydrolase
MVSTLGRGALLSCNFSPMKPPSIPLEKIRALGPACYEMTVPEEYRDMNGHMNMRYYLAIFDEAGEVLHEQLGLTAEFHARNQTGTVDLEHHVHFLSEVMPGDRVSVYFRMAAWSPKRLHYLMFMVNERNGRLSSIFECMNAFADLKVRKTAPFPPEIAARVAAGVAASDALDWPAPICGAMSA